MSKKNFNKARKAFADGRKKFNASDFPLALDIIAFKILNDAKRGAPVDTGALRASGRVKRTNQYQRIVEFGGRGSGVDYAAAVEFGTINRPPVPFLRRALLKNKKIIKQAGLKVLTRRLDYIARSGSS